MPGCLPPRRAGLLVGVDHGARQTPRTETDRHVNLAVADAVPPPGARAEREHAQIGHRETDPLADGAVDHDPGPPVGDGEGRDAVSHECRAERATSVHDEDASAARLGYGGAHQAVVVEAATGSRLVR